MTVDERLRKLQEQILNKRSVEAKLKELHSQQDSMEKELRELKKIMWVEQADVDKLEKTSLTSVFYTILGKKDDKLQKEKAEAYAAKLKYDSAFQEAELVKEDIGRFEAEISAISGAEKEYEKLLDEKLRDLKTSGSAAGEEIFRVEEQIVSHENQKKEISEAVSAGKRALNTTNRILSSLDDAEGWGIYDMIGGGLISGIAKHGHLDDAQAEVQMLRSELREFKTELSDVTISADVQISIDGFLRFADYFFDGLIADWAVMDSINRSQADVTKTKAQILKVLDELENLSRHEDLEIAQLNERKKNLILNS